MATRKNRSKYRRKRKSSNRFGMLSINVVVLLLLTVVSFKSYQLHQASEEYKLQQESLQEEIDSETDRQAELAEQEEYMQTDEYIEEQAREIGLVYPNEVILKSDDE